MGAGAEDHAGIQPDGQAVGILVGIQPLGNNHKALTDGDGLIVLLPVVLPVLVLEVGDSNFQGAKILAGVLPAEQLKLVLEVAHSLHGLGVILQIEADLRKTFHFFLESLVYIVPILLILLQKSFKLRLIVHNKAVVTQHGQPFANQLNPGGAGLNAQFQPLHCCLLIKPRPKGRDSLHNSLHESGQNHKSIILQFSLLVV